jgi:adenine-specific DNA-methyltransferase
MSKRKGIQTYSTPKGAVRALLTNGGSGLYRGDCLELIANIPADSIDLIVTSPPYCIGMEYEKSRTVEEFLAAHKRLLPEIIRITKPGGSICWQIGSHVSKQAVYPLDYAVFSLLEHDKRVTLRNRIIWSFAHGLHSSTRFSGRHETVLWYTKGKNYFFDLNAVRVPQKYPGKRHYKGPSKGEFSGNPLGKNPGDVWEIPNVKGNHVEKVGHPCQFPVALVQRLIRALCPVDGVLLDPFMGSGSAGIAALVENRRFLGAELDNDYFKMAVERLASAAKGEAEFRPIERPIFTPDPNSELATAPPHFRHAAE